MSSFDMVFYPFCLMLAPLDGRSLPERRPALFALIAAALVALVGLVEGGGLL